MRLGGGDVIPRTNSASTTHRLDITRTCTVILPRVIKIRMPPIPALALSGVADDACRALALCKGFEKHLTKPVDIDGLVGAIVCLRAKGDPSQCVGIL